MLQSLNWLPGWLPTDELVDAIKEQGRQIEELQQNFNKLNSKVSIKALEENKQESKQWSTLFENKIETLMKILRKSKDEWQIQTQK